MVTQDLRRHTLCWFIDEAAINEIHQICANLIIQLVKLDIGRAESEEHGDLTERPDIGTAGIFRGNLIDFERTGDRDYVALLQLWCEEFGLYECALGVSLFFCQRL